MNKATVINIPIKSDKKNPRKSNIQTLSRFLYSSCRTNTNTEKMLAYIIEYSNKGFYYTFKNARKKCCEQLDISIDTYNKTLKELVSLGLLKRFVNGNGSNYSFYKLNDTICRMIRSKSDIELVIKTNIATDKFDY